MSTSFKDLGVPADLVAALERRGITTPFEVQAVTLPDALAGRDVCGRAPTGSGKTLAFGIPLVARVEHARSGRPRALVLVPTRELAAQIQREIEPLARARRRSVAVVYGGVGYEPQCKALRRGVDILVACPGRLADLLNQRALTLSDVNMVVIDEADRMADMGFLPEVRRLLDQTAERRQTMLFSATLDGDVAVITREYQHDAARHEVGAAEPDIHLAQHHFWHVESNDRLTRAAEVIGHASPTIVFTRTRHGADRVAKQLGQAGVHATPIHGGRSQGQRDRALKDFQHGRVDALVATDVAARGIHVDDVACVLHFDPPADAKTYQHRSGRTARAGASGIVVSFLSRDQVRDARRMQRVLGLPGDVTQPDPRDLDDSNCGSPASPARVERVEHDDRENRSRRASPGRRPERVERVERVEHDDRENRSRRASPGRRPERARRAGGAKASRGRGLGGSSDGRERARGNGTGKPGGARAASNDRGRSDPARGDGKPGAPRTAAGASTRRDRRPARAGGAGVPRSR